MSLLRILRNLAVLAILTVGILSLSPRPTAAQSSCRPQGSACTHYGVNPQCCFNWCYFGHCCSAIHNAYCTSALQCCSRSCILHHCV